MPTLSRPLFGRSTRRGSPGADLDRDIAHDYRRAVGAWLRQARLNAGLTQQQVADHLGVGFTAISAIEVGRGSVPPERYEEMSALLEIDRQEFGKTMLRYTNPWCYAMIFGARGGIAKDLAALSPRAPSPRKGKPKE